MSSASEPVSSTHIDVASAPIARLMMCNPRFRHLVTRGEGGLRGLLGLDAASDGADYGTVGAAAAAEFAREFKALPRVIKEAVVHFC